MAEIRRDQRWIEYIDPVTGEKTYRDEVTGEVASAAPGTEVTERVVTERNVPATGQVVSERVVTHSVDHPVAGPVGAPGSVHTQESEVYTDDPYARRRTQTYKLQQGIYLLFGILEGLLAIRFVLKLLAANPSSGFGSFIYGITAPFMAPFASLFGQPSAGGSVVEFNALVAIVVYALIAWVLVKLVWLAAGETRSGVRTSEVNRRIDR